MADTNINSKPENNRFFEPVEPQPSEPKKVEQEAPSQEAQAIATGAVTDVDMEARTMKGFFGRGQALPDMLKREDRERVLPLELGSDEKDALREEYHLPPDFSLEGWQLAPIETPKPPVVMPPTDLVPDSVQTAYPAGDVVPDNIASLVKPGTPLQQVLRNIRQRGKTPFEVSRDAAEHHGREDVEIL